MLDTEFYWKTLDVRLSDDQLSKQTDRQTDRKTDSQTARQAVNCHTIKQWYNKIVSVL